MFAEPGPVQCIRSVHRFVYPCSVIGRKRKQPRCYSCVLFEAAHKFCLKKQHMKTFPNQKNRTPTSKSYLSELFPHHYQVVVQIDLSFCVQREAYKPIPLNHHCWQFAYMLYFNMEYALQNAIYLKYT